MKLYKCMDEVSGREFLRTGRVKVDCRDGKSGVIFFSPQKRPQDIPADSLMLEFEVSDYSLLDPSSRPREQERTMHIQLSNSERIDTEYWIKLVYDFKLETIYIAPDCQIGWKYVRRHLKAMGHAQAEIKILAREFLSGENRAIMVIDEWFAPKENGLQHLKRNAKCPNEYEVEVVEDVGESDC